MAALGAAAGAFEGDNAREEQRARRAGLGLQAASLAQNDRQFAESQKLDREKMAADEADNAQKRQDNIGALAMQQVNADRTAKLEEKKFQAGQERDLYQRDRSEKQDAWKSALDEQTIKEKQQEYEKHQAEFSKYKAAQDKELEQLANREKMAKNGMSYLMQLAYMSPNGVVAKEAISMFNKENGTNMSGAYLDKNTGNFITEEIGQDGEPAQVPVDRVKQENFLRTWVGDSVADSFFERSNDAEKNAFNLKRDEARYKSQLDRDKLKSGNIVDPLKKIRYSGLQRQQDKIISELAELDPTDTEGYAAKQTLLEGIEEKMAELEGVTVVPKPKDKSGSKLGFVKGGGGAGYGARNDGITQKGKGWLGELKLPDGSVATEYTIGVNLGGKETDIPTLVPTLSRKEVDMMVNDIIPNRKPIPKEIIQKAVDHAKKMISEGKGVFIDNNGTNATKSYTQEEAKSLPSGTIYLGVDGKKHKRV